MAEPGGKDRASALGRLSAGQLACLRLVMDGHTSKLIAKELGISPHTVDQRLRIAIQTLEVENRFQAARLVRQLESGIETPPAYQPPHQPAYQPLAIVETDKADLPPISSGETDGLRRHDDQSVVGEARRKYEPLPTDFSLPSPPPANREGGQRNDLAPVTRIAWTVGLMIGVILALGFLVTAAESLVRLLQAARP